MSKLLFVPFSMISGILAGIVGKKTFELLWRAVDNQPPPDPEHRDVTLKKLIPALALEGAIFRVVRGLFDHGARRTFSRLAGTWPGEEHPDAA